MFKTISAALLAVSVIAAPAMATAALQTTHAPAVKTEQMKRNVLNANAKMGRHHPSHYHHHHFHKKMGALKTRHFSKVTVKHATPAIKRG